ALSALSSELAISIISVISIVLVFARDYYAYQKYSHIFNLAQRY
ncbi:5935_t:CDS:1, partial [Gigaspora margarita]